MGISYGRIGIYVCIYVYIYGRIGIYACIYGRIGNLRVYLRYLAPKHQENAYIHYLQLHILIVVDMYMQNSSLLYLHTNHYVFMELHNLCYLH